MIWSRVYDFLNLERFSPQQQRFIILLCALAARLPLMFIFFGSRDMRNEIPINKLIFAHTQGQFDLPYPYFPLVGMFTWAAGVLNIYTELPLSFCYKIFPVFFDVLLALLVYDIFKRTQPKDASFVGLMYAFAPIPLLINCIHFQWDSVVLFCLVLAFYIRDYFKDSLVKYFTFGVLFALSFLFKPYTLAFIFFFFTPFKGFSKKMAHVWVYIKITTILLLSTLLALFLYFKISHISIMQWLDNCVNFMGAIGLGLFIVACLTALVFGYYKLYQVSPADIKNYYLYQVMSLVGLLSCCIVVCVILHLLDFNVLSKIDFLLRYANTGAPQFGLPFAYPFTVKPLSGLLANRFWLLGLIGIVSYYYFKQQLDVFTGILLSFLIMIGLAGLYTPYLQWPFLFFLLAGFYRLGALYNLMIATFLLLYFCNPLSNYLFPYESMLSFAALRSFAWLMPPKYLSDPSFIPILALMSNYLIPLYSLGVSWYGISRARHQALIFLKRQKKKFILFQNGYLIASLVLVLPIVALWRMIDTRGFDALLDRVVVRKMLWYRAIQLSPMGNIFTALFTRGSWFNIVNILFGLAVIWALLVWNFSSYKIKKL